MAASFVTEGAIPGPGVTTLDDTPSPSLIDTAIALAEMVDSIEELPTHPPSLYIDLEGDNLSRDGTISILQIHVLPTQQTYLLDVHNLQGQCFSTTGRNGRSFRDILESDAIPKVFFDVRNDSDALYHRFQIRLGGIQDLQLMELGSRTFSRRYVNGLSKCIDRDAPLSHEERLAWKRIKENGVRLFAPERGGSYQVFNQRPLSNDMVLYCVQDVQFLPRLWTRYRSKLNPMWWQRVLDASKERVNLSQSSGFIGKGQHMALCPPGWAPIYG